MKLDVRINTYKDKYIIKCTNKQNIIIFVRNAIYSHMLDLNQFRNKLKLNRYINFLLMKNKKGIICSCMIFVFKINISINTNNNNNNTSIKRIRIYNYLKYKILNKFSFCFIAELFLSVLKTLIFLEFQSLKHAYAFRNLKHIKQNMNIFFIYF